MDLLSFAEMAQDCGMESSKKEKNPNPPKSTGKRKDSDTT
jgi:hypothetical protein